MSSAYPHKAVFLDRDGTIIEEHDYPDSEKKIVLYENSVEALKMLKEDGFKLIIITNQSGIARGLFTLERLEELNNYLKKTLSDAGVEIDGIYFCPHQPDGEVIKYSFKCFCRKPKPGMLLKAIEDLQLEEESSFVVGDKLSDILTSVNVDVKSVLVKTGYGLEEIKKLDTVDHNPSYIAEDILDAAKWILKNQD